MAEAARDVLRGSFSRTPRAKRAKAKRMPAVLPMGMGSMITITQCTYGTCGENTVSQYYQVTASEEIFPQLFFWHFIHRERHFPYREVRKGKKELQSLISEEDEYQVMGYSAWAARFPEDQRARVKPKR